MRTDLGSCLAEVVAVAVEVEGRVVEKEDSCSLPWRRDRLVAVFRFPSETMRNLYFQIWKWRRRIVVVRDDALDNGSARRNKNLEIVVKMQQLNSNHSGSFYRGASSVQSNISSSLL